jgi:hypothetical protein
MDTATMRTLTVTNMMTMMTMRTYMSANLMIGSLHSYISRECNRMHHRMRYRTILMLSFYHTYCRKSNYNYTNQLIHILYRTIFVTKILQTFLKKRTHFKMGSLKISFIIAIMMMRMTTMMMLMMNNNSWMWWRRNITTSMNHHRCQNNMTRR